MEPRRVLRCREVQQILGVSKSTVYRLVSSGALAKPLRIGERAVAWLLADIEEFLASRERAGSDAAAPRAP